MAVCCRRNAGQGPKYLVSVPALEFDFSPSKIPLQKSFIFITLFDMGVSNLWGYHYINHPFLIRFSRTKTIQLLGYPHDCVTPHMSAAGEATTGLRWIQASKFAILPARRGAPSTEESDCNGRCSQRFSVWWVSKIDGSGFNCFWLWINRYLTRYLLCSN